ncbi:LAO/AO transport system kinase [Thermosyntropha lipolytica DSM 11003]|uniref:LAO/AO transport system kinase n=1 Tax=Thermosyntropha lipolytica DSM 11003 TaxID=1123382 RepID=A0A1M5JF20_9FIRM|nr:AsnC family protein [Thermosyntropha lipolytica]SHG38870.1 LAO/AO transport system kinase [Thermosyntropha lipolytica DSM 11003]
MEKKEKIVQALQEKAVNGKITCSEARKIAEELGVSPREVGNMCDELKIKIWACELGCF